VSHLEHQADEDQDNQTGHDVGVILDQELLAQERVTFTPLSERSHRRSPAPDSSAHAPNAAAPPTI